MVFPTEQQNQPCKDVFLSDATGASIAQSSLNRQISECECQIVTKWFFYFIAIGSLSERKIILNFITLFFDLFPWIIVCKNHRFFMPNIRINPAKKKPNKFFLPSQQRSSCNGTWHDECEIQHTDVLFFLPAFLFRCLIVIIPLHAKYETVGVVKTLYTHR